MKTELPLKPACPSGRGAEGFILPVTLIMMGLIFLLGATFLTVSATEHTIASNEVKAAKAFNIAEAGLERAKARLKDGTSSLNDFLSGTNPGPYPFGQTPGTGNSFDGGNYIVRIYDNTGGAEDGNLSNDTDRRVYIESTGTYGSARRQIVSLFQVSPPISAPGAVALIAPPGVLGTQLWNGAIVDGADWNAPADLSTCTTIAGCGTLTTNPAEAGTSYNGNPSEFEGTASNFGSPPTEADPTLTATPWNDLIAQLKPQATRTLTGSQVFSGTYTWGTPSAPEITVIDGSNLTLDGTINGAGVLILDNTKGLIVNGTLNWQGLVLYRGKNNTSLQIQGNPSSFVRIFGAVVGIGVGTSPDVEFELLGGTSFAKFSRSALGMALQSSSSSKVVSWQELTN